MPDYILWIALAAGFYIGWNIGANDAANAMGAPVGGGVLTYRRAILILVVFVFLGAFIEGGKVMETVGSDIVTSPVGVENPLSALPLIGVTALISAGLWVTVATTMGFPVSTSQAILGAVMGSGLLISFLGPVGGTTAVVEFEKLGTIATSWVLSPFGAILVAFVLYQLFAIGLRRVKNLGTINRVFSYLSIIAGCFTAYTIGSNDVGAGFGVLKAVLADFSLWTPNLIVIFGSLSLIVGALTYSRRVMQTVGRGITRLDAVTASSAQIGAAIVVLSFNQFGIPVSTSQAIVGGVIGVGIVKGAATVSKRRVGEIALTWILTPVLAAALAFCLGWVMLGILGFN